MKKAGLATAVLLTGIAVTTAPTAAMADRWYENRWVWGGTGLLLGGIVGHEIGRHNERNRHSDLYYSQPLYGAPAYAGPYYSHGGPYLTGHSYTRTTRVWPFYSRTTTYPVAAMSAPTITPAAVSMTDPRYGFGYDAEHRSQQDEPAGDVQISIGDNNQEVSISVGGRSLEPESQAVRTVQYRNYRDGHQEADQHGNRVVDVRIADDVAPPQPLPEYRPQAAAPPPAQEPPAEPNTDKPSTEE